MNVKVPDGTIIELDVEKFAQGLREGWVNFDDLGCFGPDDSWLPLRQALASNKLPSWRENFGVMVFLDAPRAYAHEYAWKFRYIFAFVLALGAYFLTCLTWLDLSISLSLVLLVVSVISLLVVLMIESPGAKLRYGLLGCGILLLIASLGDTELDAATFYLQFAFALFVASAVGAVLGAIVGHVSGTGLGMVVGHARRDRHQLPQTRTAVPEWVSAVTSEATQSDRSILKEAGSSFHEAINLDATLLDGLASSNWDEYLHTRNRVMDLGSQRALPLVEAALARLAGRSNLSFYRPGGVLVRSPGASEAAYLQIMLLAVSGQLLADPAATQRLIITVGNNFNSQLMDELSGLDNRALQIYQLLGLQMQLHIMAG